MSSTSAKTHTKTSSTSSREAVEAVIELSKNKKESTWEDSVKNTSSRISKWGETAKGKKKEARSK